MTAKFNKTLSVFSAGSESGRAHLHIFPIFSYGGKKMLNIFFSSNNFKVIIHIIAQGCGLDVILGHIYIFFSWAPPSSPGTPVEALGQKGLWRTLP
jgi:hypothetical protein